MKILTYLILLLVIGVLSPMTSFSQGEGRGHVFGSLETSFGFYFNDSKLSSGERMEAFGTNTFINLGYEVGRFRFGVEYDLFEPPLMGCSPLLEGSKLMQGFASYATPCLEIRLGTFFDQLGSGILFRAYEDRSLAINTSLMGGNVRWSPADWVVLKGFAGVPKKFLKYAKTTVCGADVELSLHECLFRESDATLLLGGSWVFRKDCNESKYQIAPQSVRGYSGRLQFAKGAFSLGGEYVVKSKQQMAHALYGILSQKGDALLLNGGVDYAGFGLSVEYRTLRYMEFNMDDLLIGECLTLNYLPSLTKQHKYALMALFPHKTEGVGETGGQFDLFGEIPCGAVEPIDFSVNGAVYHGLKAKDEKGNYYFFKPGAELQFAELGLELQRKWNKKLKTIMAFAWQRKEEFSRLGLGKMLMDMKIGVADVLYKFTKKTSLRVELSHAWSDSKDDQAWAYALAEVGFAPAWMFYLSDMYNYKTAGKQIHYYSIGGSYSWKMLRAAFAYGRNRAGMQCSGGVCRYVPEYSGLTLNLSAIF